MDSHHVAHYGIAAALAAGLVGVFWHTPAAPPTWPLLGAEKASAVVTAAVQSVHNHAAMILCASPACKGITRELLKAAKEAHLDVEQDTSATALPEGLTVAAFAIADGAALKAAIEKSSGGALKVRDVMAPYGETYISFGALPEPGEH